MRWAVVATAALLAAAGCKSGERGEADGPRPAGPRPGIYNVRDFGAVGDNRTDDTGAIQRALDAACGRSVGDMPGNVVFPPGQYVVKKPLATRPWPPYLRGEGGANLVWRGPTVDAFLLTVQGPTSLIAKGPVVQGLTLRCGDKVGGIRLVDQTYGQSLSDVTLYKFRGRGFDVSRAWGMRLVNLRVFGGNGAALSLKGHNGGTLDGLVVHGAQGTAWSADTPADERACVYLGGSSGAARDIQIENCNYAASPLLLIEAKAKRVEALRFEGAYGVADRRQSERPIVIRNSHGVRLSDVWYYARFDPERPPEQTTPETVVTLEGSRHCIVENIYAGHVRGAIVRIGPDCYDTTAREVFAGAWWMPASQAGQRIVKPPVWVEDRGTRTSVAPSAAIPAGAGR